MPDLNIEPLLSALEGDMACGADLEYDPAFLALQEAAAGKPETQYGEKVFPATSPDWAKAYAKAHELSGRTRDLRVAVWLVRSAARVEGLGLAVRGLQLVQGLIERHWDNIHPRLDANDGNDPTSRVNALSQLSHTDAGLADLRAAALTEARGGLTVRDLELGLDRVEPLPGEVVPTEEGVLKALRAAIAASPRLGQTLLAGHEAVVAIDKALVERIGAQRAPDLGPLRKLLAVVAQAARRATGTATAEDDAAPPVGTAPGVKTSGAVTIDSREEAIRSLQRVCDWIERNEPSNPAPLLIRRAQRLMTKDFLEIIRDLVPDSVDNIEKLAGIGHG